MTTRSIVTRNKVPIRTAVFDPEDHRLILPDYLVNLPRFTIHDFRIRIRSMINDNLNETQPTSIGGETVPTPVVPQSPHGEEQFPQKGKRSSWLKWLLIAIALLIAVITLSGLFGYQKGIAVRKAFEGTQVAIAVGEQFTLGVGDIEAGRYEVARQRFEYIIGLDPGYPGVADRLAEVLLALNVTATPTLSPPTPTAIVAAVTPTPDTRGEAELFAQAEDYILNEEWDAAIETLETLRKFNPDYRAIDIDGMLYISLRQRGVKKVSFGNLEGGIYDLSLAERFGILDSEADSWRTWARYYITGASFWEIDWGQAVYYFEQVAPTFPNMHDGNGWFASQRYFEALVHYAEYYASMDKPCQAEEQYIKARDYSGDTSLDENIETMADLCR